MNILDISKSVETPSITNVAEAMRKRIQVIEYEKRTLINMLKVCGYTLSDIGDVEGENENHATTQTKTRKQQVRERKSSRRGAPNELFEEVIQNMNGDFTIDQLLSTVKRTELDFDRTQIMNAIQSLIKNGKVKIIHSGKGRAIAIYAKSNGKKIE